MKDINQKLNIISQEIDETYKPEIDLTVRILQQRLELKITQSSIASSAHASAVLASIASKGKSHTVELQQETSALFEHHNYTQVQPEVEHSNRKQVKI